MDNNYALPYPDAISLGIGIDDKARQIKSFQYAGISSASG
jgi:hypothetical protein